MANRIQFRRDTAANWTAANPVLALGEPAHETDTGMRKVGDGTTAWAALPYTGDAYVGRDRGIIATGGRLLSALRSAEESVALVCGPGDSLLTTNGKTRWPEIVSNRLAAKFPKYAVQRVTWDDTNKVWGAPVVVSGTPSQRTYTITTQNGLTHPGSGETITGDIDVRVKWTPAAWPAAANVPLASNSDANNYAWTLGVNTSGQITWQSNDGTASPGQKQSATLSTSTVVLNQPIWFRATLVASSGLVSFYTSTDGATWTAQGTAAGTATSLRNLNSLKLGVLFGGGAANTGQFTYNEIEIRNGIGGPSIVPRWPDAWTAIDSTAGVGTLAGKPVLTVVVSGIPGASIDFLTDPARLPYIVGYSWNPALWIASCSHNDQQQRGSSYWSKWDTLLSGIRNKLGVAEVALLTQNPKISPAQFITAHRQRLQEEILWARKNGLTVLDGYSAFMTSAKPLTTLVDTTDGIHPSDSDGSPLLADTVMRGLFSTTQ